MKAQNSNYMTPFGWLNFVLEELHQLLKNCKTNDII